MTRLSVFACLAILVASIVHALQQLHGGAYPGSITSALIMASVLVQQTGNRTTQRQVIGWTLLALAMIVLLGQIATTEGVKTTQ